MAAAIETEEPTRRDFLYIATGAFAAVGAAAFVWPLIDQMNPDASVLALASTEVDLTPLQEGQSITITWRGADRWIISARKANARQRKTYYARVE